MVLKQFKLNIPIVFLIAIASTNFHVGRFMD